MATSAELHPPPWPSSCCSQAATENQVLRAKLNLALEEINVLRKLLSVPPLDDIDLPSAFVASPPSSRVFPGTLESMPTEVLERIASGLDAISFVRFCHVCPRLKYASQVLHVAGIAVEMTPDSIWPDFSFTYPEEAPTSVVFALYNLCRLLNRFGGVVCVDAYFASEHFASYLPWVTTRVDIIDEDGRADLLGLVKLVTRSEIRVRRFEVYGCSVSELAALFVYGRVAGLYGIHLMQGFPCKELASNRDLIELSFAISRFDEFLDWKME
ncbi:hypothetical protein HDU98_011848, partial [Podochytrium sp. JEL0797]